MCHEELFIKITNPAERDPGEKQHVFHGKPGPRFFYGR